MSCLDHAKVQGRKKGSSIYGYSIPATCSVEVRRPEEHAKMCPDVQLRMLLKGLMHYANNYLRLTVTDDCANAFMLA